MDKGTALNKLALFGQPVKSSLSPSIHRMFADQLGLDIEYRAVETGRADAYASDDVLLYGLVSKSKKPDDYQVTGRFLSFDPYGIMVPQNDSLYRRIGTVTLADLMRSGEAHEIYDKWFNPGPTGINMPMSDTLRIAFEIQALPH